MAVPKRPGVVDRGEEHRVSTPVVDRTVPAMPSVPVSVERSVLEQVGDALEHVRELCLEIESRDELGVFLAHVAQAKVSFDELVAAIKDDGV